MKKTNSITVAECADSIGLAMLRDLSTATRAAVAEILRVSYPRYHVYVGGHHVALHDPGDGQTWGPRVAMICGSGPDW